MKVIDDLNRHATLSTEGICSVPREVLLAAVEKLTALDSKSRDDAFVIEQLQKLRDGKVALGMRLVHVNAPVAFNVQAALTRGAKAVHAYMEDPDFGDDLGAYHRGLALTVLEAALDMDIDDVPAT